MEWNRRIIGDKLERRQFMSRVSHAPRPAQDGIGRALRGAYSADIEGLPKDMQELLARLK